MTRRATRVDLREVLARHQAPTRAYTRPTGRTWYEIRNAQAKRAAGGPTYAEVYLYDEIGFWGVSAGSFIGELNALDVDEIDLHINSPGGDLFDGVAIYQALVDHPATILCSIDGLAASIASVIAMAGDTVTMAEMSRMFIHDAWGFCQGNAGDMRTMADMLDDFSGMISKAYAGRAGGTAAQWRKAMIAETWYSPEDAVAAGLADSITRKPEKDDEAEAAAARLPAAARRSHPESEYPWLQRTAAAADPDVVEEPPPASPAAPAAPGPVDDPGEDGDEEEEPESPAVAGLDIAALLRDEINPPPPPPLEPGALAGILRHEIENAPAVVPPTPPPPSPEPGPADLSRTVTDALKEAMTP